MGSFGFAAPVSLAFSRHQSGLKGVVVTGVTLGHWHIQMSEQQRIFEVFQTQQRSFTGEETEAREGELAQEHVVSWRQTDCQMCLCLAGQSGVEYRRKRSVCV